MLISVTAIMAKINAYRYESDDGLVVWLQEKADMMSFSEIVEKLGTEVEGNE